MRTTPSGLTFGETTPSGITFGETTPSGLTFGETSSGLTFGEMTPSGLTFGEPYNLKVLVSNTINCAKQDIQNRLDSSIPEGGEL